MADIEVTRSTSLSVAQAWAAVTDFAGHGDVIPLTTIVTDPGRPRLGWRFAGVTRLGPVRFTDPMLVTTWEPPQGSPSAGRVRLVKIGRWLQGWAEITVEAEGEGACVTWCETLRPRPDPLPALSRPISSMLGKRLFERALDGLLTDGALDSS